MKNFVSVLFAMSVLVGGLYANTLGEIRAKKVVRVGVYEAEPPFSKKTESGFEGFEVELANKLANAIFAKNCSSRTKLGAKFTQNTKFA